MSPSHLSTRKRNAKCAFEGIVESQLTSPTRQNKVRHVMSNVESSEPAKKATSKPKSAGRRTAAYVENDGGFQFSRTRLKQAPTESRGRDSDLKNEPDTVKTTGSSASNKTRLKRKKLVIATTAGGKEVEVPIRRSARLSGEVSASGEVKDVVKSTVTRKRKQDKSKEPETTEGAGSRAPVDNTEKEFNWDESGSFQIEANRQVIKIALPFADTPVIQRNQAMRKRTGQTHRRSSMGLRGHRASSLIDSGTSNAIPHPDVGMEEFYKHIDPNIPEPKRMKQLLTWCAGRLLSHKPAISDGMSSNELLANEASYVILKEVLLDISTKPEISDWFCREENDGTNRVLKENPRNIQMRCRLEELEIEIQELEQQKKAWEEELSKAEGLFSHTADDAKEDELDDETQIKIEKALSTMGGKLLVDGYDGDINDEGNKAKDWNKLVECLKQRLGESLGGIETHLDVLAEGVNGIEELRKVGHRVGERIIERSTLLLEVRDACQRGENVFSDGMNGLVKDRVVEDTLSALATTMKKRQEAR